MSDIAATSTPLQLTIHPLPDDEHEPRGQFWSNEAPTFKDFLDTINPLQHIPIISSIYQALTGDVPSSGSKIAGGALFGGPIGLVASLFDTIIQNNTGTDITGNVLAALKGDTIPALHVGDSGETRVANAVPDHLGPKQRAAYNAYVNASLLT